MTKIVQLLIPMIIIREESGEWYTARSPGTPVVLNTV